MTILRIPVRMDHAALPSPAFNIWHARFDVLAQDALDALEPTSEFMDALHTFYVAASGTIASGTTVTFPISAVSPANSQEMTITTPASITCTGGNPGMLGAALTCSWKTSIAGRRARGRTFLGPIGAGMVGQDGKIAEAQRVAVENAAKALINTSKAANGWAFGVWGQQNAGQAEPKVLRDIIGVVASKKPAHLRSRRD